MTGKTRLVLLLVAAATILLATGADSANAFQLGNRWTLTATDGGGLTQGMPTTITWSIVPDGTTISGVGSSDLIAQFDNRFNVVGGGPDLTDRPWFTYFEQSFQRWEELGGNTYVYEPMDDGVTQGTSTFRGILGTRGDVRIAGDFLDGASGTLAFNDFPNNGDMTMDTGDMQFFGNPTQNYRRLRNVVMHEHGHGSGMFHVESNTNGFLMEPFIQTNFDGPQIDDILGHQRHYGDVLEKNGGNNTAATATDIGTFNDGDSWILGTHGRNTVIFSSWTDFVSIDDDNDFDYFTFNVPDDSSVNIDLTPVGPTYNQGPQGGGQSQTDRSSISNLTLQLIDSDQTTVLDLQNAGTTGEPEFINDFAVDAGQYYIRVSGAANNIQMYEIELNVAAVSMTIDGDFNDDGFWDDLDVNELTNEIAAMTDNPDYDLNGDDVVDTTDLSDWLVEGGSMNPAETGGNPFLGADANLDGFVDGFDLLSWNANRSTASANFTDADFNADGIINELDFEIWNGLKFQSSAGAPAVPEPSSLASLVFAVCLLGVRRRR